MNYQLLCAPVHVAREGAVGLEEDAAFGAALGVDGHGGNDKTEQVEHQTRDV